MPAEHRPLAVDRTVLNSRFDFVMTEEQLVRPAGLDDLDDEFFRRHLRKQGFGLRRGGSRTSCPTIGTSRWWQIWMPDPRRRCSECWRPERTPPRFPHLHALPGRNTAYNGTGRGSGVLLAADADGQADEQVDRTPSWARSFGKREIRGNRFARTGGSRPSNELWSKVGDDMIRRRRGFWFRRPECRR